MITIGRAGIQARRVDHAPPTAPIIVTIQNHKIMKVKDQVAIILTKYGFDLTTGLDMYNECVTSKKKELVRVDHDKDCVVWLSFGLDNDGPQKASVMVWRYYGRDFCLNYTLVGAIALHDGEFDLTDEQTSKFMDFFQKCGEAYKRGGEECPDIPDDITWIFKGAALTDYMQADHYDISEKTDLSIKRILL